MLVFQHMSNRIPDSPRRPVFLRLLTVATLSLFVLGATSTPERSEAVALAEATPTKPAPLPELNSDSRNAVPFHAELVRRLEAMPASELADVQAAASRLVRNCPYNRASAELPIILDELLQPHYALLDQREFGVGWTSPVLIERLTTIRAALAEHRRLLTTLGLHPLPQPQSGDYLARAHAYQPAWAPESGASARIEHTLARLEAVNDLVASYDEETLAVIDAANAIVGPALDDRWPLQTVASTYRTTLWEIEALAGSFKNTSHDRVAPGIGALAERCRRLTPMLDSLLNRGC